MKVFALGGYGTVGLPAVKLLAQSDLVTKIAIVGRSLVQLGGNPLAVTGIILFHFINKFSRKKYCPTV